VCDECFSYYIAGFITNQLLFKNPGTASPHCLVLVRVDWMRPQKSRSRATTGACICSIKISPCTESDWRCRYDESLIFLYQIASIINVFLFDIRFEFLNWVNIIALVFIEDILYSFYIFFGFPTFSAWVPLKRL
jgi:hypothetical protein